MFMEKWQRGTPNSTASGGEKQEGFAPLALGSQFHGAEP